MMDMGLLSQVSTLLPRLPSAISQQPRSNCEIAAVTLLGLDLTMNPATARQLVASGHICALPEEYPVSHRNRGKCYHRYDQQNFTPFIHASVSPERLSVVLWRNADFSRSVAERTPLRTSSALYISERLHRHSHGCKRPSRRSTGSCHRCKAVKPASPSQRSCAILHPSGAARRR